MKSAFPVSKNKILLTVAFDDHLDGLLKSAENLCLASGASLRLLHVCDPWSKSFLSTVADVGAVELMDALKDEAARIAGRRLDYLRRTISKKVKIETNVVTGDIGKSVAADAEESSCGMILVGASKGGAAGTLQGFSTAISVVMESAVPVMVLNDRSVFNPRNGRPVVLACDDFSEGALAALEVGCSLATVAEGSRVVHVHIESYGDLHSHVKLRDTKTNKPINVEQLEHLRRQAEDKMTTRAGEWPMTLESMGASYDMELVSGSVPDEIERSANAIQADVVVFGQHRVFHRKSMHVGQVPYKAMLSLSRPVIVVPVQT